MLKFTFCPTFTVFSFVFFITCFDIFMYILTLCWTMFSSDQTLDSGSFLGPSYEVLINFGAKDDEKCICNYQVWRYLSPMVLHGGFVHIFTNMVSQLILGFMLESIMGPIRIAILYICSGMGGILFSMICARNEISVGASTAIYGLIGGFLSLIVVNWKAFDRHPEIRCCIIIMIVFILVFGLLFALGVNLDTDTVQGVDVYGHLGGFLTGTFVGMYVMVHLRGDIAKRPGSFERRCQIIGVALLFVYLAVCVPVLYTTIKHKVC
mmetsp:Transcript_25194/g.18991  ORF Transcript_25194/g.18991 Transcript_25194/m.18991 type:complete len:265 (-) Transcript_25194:29-823(-)